MPSGAAGEKLGRLIGTAWRTVTSSDGRSKSAVAAAQVAEREPAVEINLELVEALARAETAEAKVAQLAAELVHKEEILAEAIVLFHKVASLPDADSEPLSTPQKVTAEILERFALLQQQLDDYDSEAEDRLDSLMKDLVGSGVVELLAPIAKAVSAYEFEWSIKLRTKK